MTNGKFQIEVDEGEIKKILSELGDDTYLKQKVLVNALKKGGEVLQKETVQIMKSKLGATATSTNHHKKPMSKGVRVIVDKNYYDVIVSIMKDYRLKWFEKGTDERFTKGKITGRAMITKGDGRRERNIRDNNKIPRGRIEGKLFFAEATNTTTGIDEAVFASIDQQLNKIFNR